MWVTIIEMADSFIMNPVVGGIPAIDKIKINRIIV